jgi:hypothetical protein
VSIQSDMSATAVYTVTTLTARTSVL